jgi:hypothetical protein
MWRHSPYNPEIHRAWRSLIGGIGVVKEKEKEKEKEIETDNKEKTL